VNHQSANAPWPGPRLTESLIANAKLSYGYLLPVHLPAHFAGLIGQVNLNSRIERFSSVEQLGSRGTIRGSTRI